MNEATVFGFVLEDMSREVRLTMTLETSSILDASTQERLEDGLRSLWERLAEVLK